MRISSMTRATLAVTSLAGMILAAAHCGDDPAAVPPHDASATRDPDASGMPVTPGSEGGVPADSGCTILGAGSPGAPDPTFHGGLKTFARKIVGTNKASSLELYDVTIDAQGRVYVVGACDRCVATGHDVVVGRFTTSGDPDTSYGATGDGWVALDFGDDERGYRIAIDASGRAVVGTLEGLLGTGNGALFRLDANGAIDKSYRGLLDAGYPGLDVPVVGDGGATSSYTAQPAALVANGDGVILSTKLTDAFGTPTSDALLSITPTGAVDPRWSPPKARLFASGVHGAHVYAFAPTTLRRYALDDGGLDRTWGNVDGGGAALTLDGGDLAPTNAVIDSAGRVTVGARGDGNAVAVVRYDATGHPDPSFASYMESVTFDPGLGSVSVGAIAALCDGRTVVQTATKLNGPVLLRRLAANGTRDPSYGDGGTVVVPTADGGVAAVGAALFTDPTTSRTIVVLSQFGTNGVWLYRFEP